MRGVFLAVVGSMLVGCAGGLPKIPNSPEAILQKADDLFEREKYFQSTELYKQFLARHPGHDRSDYAQYMLAESYFLDEEYPLAVVEYRVLVNNYGYSDWVDDALLKVGLCFYEQMPDPKRDQQKAYDALSQFEQFLVTFPQSPLVEVAKEHIKRVHATLAEKEFNNGYYYYRRKRIKAALIYFDKVIDSYSGNDYWARALYYKGVILLERGNSQEAAELFERVLSYPGDVEVKEGARGAISGLGQ